VSGDGLGTSPAPVGRHRTAVEVGAGDLRAAASTLLDRGMRLALVSGHDDGGSLRVVYLFTSGPPDTRIELRVTLPRDRPEVPTLAEVSFPASRFERELRDLFGIEPVGHPQPRRLVLHQHWPEGWHPMRGDAGEAPPMVDDAGHYPFVPVEGTGVYEIPVGPVHAGMIEPGHFRFWVVGETILRMKARLWFVHKGIEQLFEGREVGAGLELAERISGDTAVGHGLAYCTAVEDALDLEVAPDAVELRGVLLELERVVNHVSDIGALCNDVGFGLGHMWALSLRETLLRRNRAVTGHRLLRGGVVPGGARVLRLPTAAELAETGDRFEELVDLALSNAFVTERFTGTAVLGERHARELGVVGPAARASGVGCDARVAHPTGRATGFAQVVRTEGDVMARFLVRVDEVRAALALLGDASGRVPSGGPVVDGVAGARPRDPTHGGVGIVEGWRGAVVHRVEIDGAGRLRRVKVVDPSFMNWPAVPVSLADTIVPDFPLANKSFNLSYAGNDL
jgi:Ni,Fe-hydrogenase III large subunit/Ni,Fe-hydrogenase III component G